MTLFSGNLLQKYIILIINVLILDMYIYGVYIFSLSFSLNKYKINQTHADDVEEIENLSGVSTDINIIRCLFSTCQLHAKTAEICRVEIHS